MIAYKALSAYLIFPNEDQKQWWEDTAPLYAGFLRIAQYELEAQFIHLLFHFRYVLPSLGPFPQKGEKRINTAMPGGRPFEISLNFQKSGSTVRFDFEPVTCATGSVQEEDQFNLSAVADVVSDLERNGLGPNTVLYDRFERELSLTPDDLSLFKTKNAKQTATTQYVVAWDLHESNRRMKMYWFPAVKALASGQPKGPLAFDAIRRVDFERCYANSLLMVEKYLSAAGLDDDLWILSWDCEKPGSSRVKLYVSAKNITRETLEDVWTLGGRVTTPATLDALALLQELWQALTPTEQDTGIRMTISYELVPGSDTPQPKAYLPLCDKNDMEVAKTLSVFFKRLGWMELAQSYTESLCSN
jgi:DMATS type aromatic prenyltransferase